MNIRKFNESDLMNLHGTLSDPDVMKYIEPIFNLEKTKEFINSVAISDSPLIYAVEDDKGNYIGYVIYHDYEDNSIELGWLLNKQEWGKGYASKLTELMIEKAAKEGKDAIIECSPLQSATIHIAEKYGFVYEGHDDNCNIYRLNQHLSHTK